MKEQDVRKHYFYQEKEYSCSLELAMELIGGKWKMMMVYLLKDAPLRSSDLQRAMNGISNKMFAQTAKELERDKLIEKKIYPVIPPKVEYRITSFGKTVLPLVEELATWGIDAAAYLGASSLEIGDNASGKF